MWLAKNKELQIDRERMPLATGLSLGDDAAG